MWFSVPKPRPPWTRSNFTAVRNRSNREGQGGDTKVKTKRKIPRSSRLFEKAFKDPVPFTNLFVDFFWRQTEGFETPALGGEPCFLGRDCWIHWKIVGVRKNLLACL